MPLLTKTADLATRKLPKILSPETHKTADYLLTGGFCLAGLVYWNRDRRAATASMLCGGSMLALILATRYDGQPGGWMSFAEHRRTELGMAATFSLIPGILKTGKMAKAHFLIQAALLIGVGNMTHTGSQPQIKPVKP